MAARVLVLNGPNLNMLGLRQPEIYGRVTLSDVEAACVAFGTERGLEVRCVQSNHEGELVTLIQEARETSDAIVLNAGAYTHTSVAILDALNMFEGLVVELHVSQVFKREAFRHHSYISARADAVMAGFGTAGYELALDYVSRQLG